MNNKVIIDTDPGVDDAIAIMYAIKYGCNISGITTVFGNTNIENTTKNTFKILSIMNKNIQVYKGLDKPLKVEPTFAKSHGDGGFGGYDIKINQEINTIGAVEYIIKELENNNNISIICLGPTTNISEVFKQRRDLVKKVKELIILGGVVGEKGNISKFAEFNTYNDPDSLKEVLSFGINIYLIPINICRKVFFTLKDFNKINNSKISSSIKKISKQYIDYYLNDKDYGNFEGGIMYDLLALIFFTNKEIFEIKKTFIEVVTENIENIGETIEINNGKQNCNLITKVDTETLKQLFFNTMNK